MKSLRILFSAGLIILLAFSCEEQLPDTTTTPDQTSGAYQGDGTDPDEREGGEGNSATYTNVTINSSNLSYEIWPCSAEDPANQTDTRLSAYMGWEMAFNLHNIVFVAKATLNGSIITFDENKIYVTKATEFDAFSWGKNGADTYPNHYTTWYADVTGGIDARFYAPKLSEDQGWMIWTPDGKGVHFDLDSTGDSTWDIFFNSWLNWDLSVSDNPIEKFNLTPVSFDAGTVSPEVTLSGGNLTVSQNQNVNLQWTSRVSNTDAVYVILVNGSEYAETTQTSYNLSFPTDGVYNVRVKGRNTEEYTNNVTSHVDTRISGTRTITVSTPLATPELLSPAHGSSTYNSNVNFDWEYVPGATSYTLDVDGTTYTTSNTNYTVNVLSNGMHFWKVRANSATSSGSYSSTRSLTVKSPVVFTASMNGPTSVNSPDKGQSGIPKIWTASSSGSTDGVSFEWYKVIGGNDVYLKSGTSYSQTFYYNPGSTSTFILKVVATSGATSIPVIKHVTVYPSESGGGGPKEDF
ncbi:MAG: hypothetical protein RIM99_09945 [Cyclobacteriaceae bacterium]